jgi:hypothetical protein
MYNESLDQELFETQQSKVLYDKMTCITVYKDYIEKKLFEKLPLENTW